MPRSSSVAHVFRSVCSFETIRVSFLFSSFSLLFFSFFLPDSPACISPRSRPCTHTHTRKKKEKKKKRIAETDVGSPSPVHVCIDSLSCGTRFLSLEFFAERKNHLNLRPVRSVTQPNVSKNTEVATPRK